MGALVAAGGRPGHRARSVALPGDSLAFAVLGFGAAPIIPLAFTAAAQHDRLGSGIAIARVNVFNYVGFVLGAPLIGLVAEVSSLRWAFALLIPILLAVVALAPAFRVESYARG